MRRLATTALAGLVAIALGATAGAASISYTCTGADDAGLAQAIADAGDGGSVILAGDCAITAPILLNQRLTVRGPAAPSSAVSSCAVAAPASITNSAGGVFQLLSGSSGSVIDGLGLNSTGAHVIANGPLAGPFPLHQPDDVQITNNVMTSDTGRCVSQFVHNGPPFNDVSACDAVPGVPFCSTPSGPGNPVGVCTGWNISGNSCTTVNGTGVMVTGNDNLISFNCVDSGDECFRNQNNSCSSVPSVISFGAAVGASNNVFDSNICDNALDPAETFYAIGYIGLGFDFFTSEPETDICQRNTGTQFSNNCSTMDDPTPLFGFSVCMQVQKENAMTVSNNDCTALIPPVQLGNAGFVNFDTVNSTVSNERWSGVDDYGVLALNGTEYGNTFSNVGMSQGDINIPLYAVLDLGSGVDPGGNPAPNTYDTTSYCDGIVLVLGGTSTNELPNTFCTQAPGPPAAPCQPLAPNSAILVRGRTLGTGGGGGGSFAPMSLRPSGGTMDRLLSVEMLDAFDDASAIQQLGNESGVRARSTSRTPR